jgi:hypothetical protein
MATRYSDIVRDRMRSELELCDRVSEGDEGLGQMPDFCKHKHLQWQNVGPVESRVCAYPLLSTTNFIKSLQPSTA